MLLARGPHVHQPCCCLVRSSNAFWLCCVCRAQPNSATRQARPACVRRLLNGHPRAKCLNANTDTGPSCPTRFLDVCTAHAAQAQFRSRRWQVWSVETHSFVGLPRCAIQSCYVVWQQLCSSLHRPYPRPHGPVMAWQGWPCAEQLKQQHAAPGRSRDCFTANRKIWGHQLRCAPLHLN